MLPVLKDNNLYRGFWVNKHGLPFKEGFHCGKDFGLDQGENVYSVCNGKIIIAGLYNGYGSLNPSTKGGCVWIKHIKNNLIFYANYGHIVINENIKVGNEIKEGDIIGTIAHFTNYNKILPHLHFGIWNNQSVVFPSSHWGYQQENDKKSWVDPIPFLEKYHIA
jgi:murein DD-endopeptidase MepM/ murein hydrolase activator NlpD